MSAITLTHPARTLSRLSARVWSALGSGLRSVLRAIQEDQQHRADRIVREWRERNPDIRPIE